MVKSYELRAVGSDMYRIGESKGAVLPWNLLGVLAWMLLVFFFLIFYFWLCASSLLRVGFL